MKSTHIEAARLAHKQMHGGLTPAQYVEGHLSILLNHMSQGNSVPANVINSARAEIAAAMTGGLTQISREGHMSMDDFVHGAYAGIVNLEIGRVNNLKDVLNKAKSYFT